MEEHLKIIESCYESLSKMRNNVKLWSDDKLVIELLDMLSESLNILIHGELSPLRTKESEQLIRNLIRRYVIGCKEGKEIFIGMIPTIENKLALLNRQKKKDYSLIEQYRILLDDYMAIASFRSFKHFCYYLEDTLNIKLFRTLGAENRALAGYFYYANKMVLDGEVKFLEKQLPTSYGKSLSDCFMIAWIFGQDINNDVLKVFGNNSNIDRAYTTILNLMCTRQYGKVFPYFQQFNGNPDKMFSSQKAKEGKFTISGSTKSVNLEIISKEMKRSGIRAKYLFIDDVTQAEDAAAIKQHDKDIATFNNVWFKRRYSSTNFYVIASGTTYSLYDILSYLKNAFGYANATQTTINKYTKVGKSDKIINNGVSVFVCVPKLDYTTGLSTFPEEYPTEQAIKDRNDDYDTFMAMEQQEPQKPKDSPFYISQLQEYTELPAKNTFGRGDSCFAYIDGKRSGGDFCAMPICTVIDEKHYLIDAHYDDRPMKEQYPFIINKIIQHHITQLVLENNINVGLATMLRKMLEERGYTFCNIKEVFNSEQKNTRIMNAEADIKANIIFPKFGLYARSSPVGQAMDELYGYSYLKKNDHDDFTDALAGYAKAFITKNVRKYAKISIYDR